MSILLLYIRIWRYPGVRHAAYWLLAIVMVYNIFVVATVATAVCAHARAVYSPLVFFMAGSGVSGSSTPYFRDAPMEPKMESSANIRYSAYLWPPFGTLSSEAKPIATPWPFGGPIRPCILLPTS